MLMLNIMILSTQIICYKGVVYNNLFTLPVIAANLLKHTLGLSLHSAAFLNTLKFMAAHCSSVVLMSTVAVMIRASV